MQFPRLGGVSIPILLASIGISALVTGIQQLGALEETELNFYDQLVRLRPDQAPDPRLLVVTVTEDDISRLGKWPTDDRTLDQALEKLQQNKPRVIGLDIYRNLPVEPGNAELATRFELDDNIIAVCKVGDADSAGISPPPTIPENRVGFSDVVVDSSGIVRRSLLVQTPEQDSKCPARESFSLQLASHYLEKQGINLNSQTDLQLGSTLFKRIEKDSGGYQNSDAGGYQVLLNYRSAANVAQQVTLTEVLAGSVDPNLVRDRIVLIGVTAPSINDYFLTPYSKGQQQNRMAGVLVHAQATSQILSAVLDQRSLMWYWPGWLEIPWIFIWSLIGAGLAWRIRHPLALGLAEVAAIGGLFGICYAIFTQAGWIPLVPPAIALVASGASIIGYKAYKPIAPSITSPFTGQNTISTTGTYIPNESPETTNSLLKGRYKIVDDIGSGGFGRTYLAEDTQRPGKPHCVVKQLQPSRNDEKFLQLARRFFNTEAETLEKVGRHDQIPQLLAHFEQDKEFYLVQEFIKGQSLDEELSPGKRLGESQVVDMIKDALGILNFIHSQGVIHRDIKPANIIRRQQDGRLVLIDFGAVKQLQTQILGQESNTVAIGTSGFAPPEQMLGQPVFSSDIYALGIIAIQAITGTPPQLLKPLTHEIVWPNYAQVSDRCAAILDKMVRYHVSERYSSAAEVLQDIQHL